MSGMGLGSFASPETPMRREAISHCFLYACVHTRVCVCTCRRVVHRRRKKEHADFQERAVKSIPGAQTRAGSPAMWRDSVSRL